MPEQPALWEEPTMGPERWQQMTATMVAWPPADSFRACSEQTFVGESLHSTLLLSIMGDERMPRSLRKEAAAIRYYEQSNGGDWPEDH